MKIGIDNGGNWTAEYYEATVVSANDYYPFGSTMAGRKFSSGAYRYGFNGMEKDDEVKGEGNSYDFGARIFDSRVGRWLAVDPLAAKYPHLSPYNFTGNNPILYVDYDGRDFGVKIEYGEDGKTNIIIYQDIYVIDQTSYNQALEAAELWKKTTDLGDGWTVSTVVNVKEPKYNSENIKTSPDDKTLSEETVEIGKRRNKEIVPKYTEHQIIQKANILDYTRTFNFTKNLYTGKVDRETLDVKQLVVSQGDGYDPHMGHTFFGSIITMNQLTYYEGMNTRNKDGTADPILIAHEMGHTFGLDDGNRDFTKYYSSGGLMDYGTLKPPTTDDMLDILLYVKDKLNGVEPNRAERPNVIIKGEVDVAKLKEFLNNLDFENLRENE